MAMATQIVGQSLQTAGAGVQTTADYNAAMGQVDLAKYNAIKANYDARLTGQVSTAMQERQRREQAAFAGTQRAAAAQAGVGAGGSVSDILNQSEEVQILDRLNTAYMGMLQIHNYTSQAEIDTFRAKSLKQHARAVKWSGFLSAAGNAASGSGGGGGGMKTTTGGGANMGSAGAGDVGGTYAGGGFA